MAVDKEPPELGQLRDNSLLWRASLWGGAATIALATAVLMSQTDVGAQRLQFAMFSEPAPKPVTQADFTPRSEAETLKRETARLEAQVRDLAADRERLNARIATLETSLSDVTGSIKRELAAVTAKPATPPPVVSAPQVVAPPPARLVPIEPEPKKDTPPSEPSTGATAKAVPAAPAPAPSTPAASAPASSANAVPLPPTRTASAEPADAPPPPVKEGGIGIDLGGARSLEIMQARWAAVKANFGPLLDGLSPLVARDTRPNMIPYRLIVGPLPNAATAAQVCARFAASKVTCRSVRFAGEPLTAPE